MSRAEFVFRRNGTTCEWAKILRTPSRRPALACMTQTQMPILDASAVIFDVDGTLVDSVDFHAEAWQRTFSAFAFEFDLIKVRDQIGKGGDRLMPVFLGGDVLEYQGKKIEPTGRTCSNASISTASSASRRCPSCSSS